MASLVLRPLVVSCAYAEGLCAAFPASAPHFIAYGASSEEAESELIDFLGDHFERLEPDQLQSFLVSETAALRHVSVIIPRADLPRAERIRTALQVPIVEVAAPAGAKWLLIPSVGQVSYVAASSAQDVEDAVREEVLRLAAAADIDGASYLDLFPPAQIELSRPLVEIDPEQRLERKAGKSSATLRQRRAAERLLERVGRLVSKPAYSVASRPMEELQGLVSGKGRRSLALVGPEGVGKSDWFRAAVSQVGRVVYATSGAEIVAGQAGLGQLQERFDAVMSAAELLEATLYFDSFEDLFAGREGGHEDMTALLRRHLQQGRVQIVAELSAEAYERLGQRYAGIFSYLHRFNVAPLTREQTLTILQERVRADQRRGELALSSAALSQILDLADRYEPYRVLPGKAVRLYEELRARARDAASSDPSGAVTQLSPAQVLAAFASKTGIPEFLLRDDQNLHVADVRRFLQQFVIGQDHAVQRLAELLCTIKARLQPAGKPLATLLFLGPTGVGKTELAKALARFLFGSPERMARFDMSEYMDAYAADRLIRGSERADGALTQRVREQPFGVLLLDEIEKAHPNVFDLLLQVAGEGRLSDARGKVAYFHNTILILTSNLGARERRARVGFGSGGQEESASYYQRQVERHFRPELVGRLDGIIGFTSLDSEQIIQVARLFVDRIGRRAGLEARGAQLLISEAALLQLAQGGFSPEYGARGLRRYLEQVLVAPLSGVISALGAQAQGAKLLVCSRAEHDANASEGRATRPDGWSASLEDHYPSDLAPAVSEVIVISAALARQRERAQSESGINSVSRMRRSMRRWNALQPLSEVRERGAELTVLLAEVARTSGRAAERSTLQAQRMSELSREHANVRGWLDPLDEALREIEEIEGLLLSAIDETPPDLEPEASLAYQRFRGQLLWVLLQSSQQNTVTLAIHELDDRRLLHLLLLPWLHFAQRQNWEVVLHFDRVARDGDWPTLEQRRWGPPIAMNTYLTKVPEPRPADAVLLRMRGAGAAAFAAFYLGRYRRPDREGVGELWVRYLRPRFEVRAEDWEHSDFRASIDRSVGRGQPLLAEFAEASASRSAASPALAANSSAAGVTVSPSELFDSMTDFLFERVLERVQSGKPFLPPSRFDRASPDELA
ncbi:MAG TPA: AAA family ATPase [Polyangiaceae bacterium]|nr:AAA family ATPase [Polyangiaceae bacterium]